MKITFIIANTAERGGPQGAGVPGRAALYIYIYMERERDIDIDII